MTTYIYIVKNLSKNLDEVYVGKTINPLKRKNDHRKTYGSQISFQIIDEIKSIHRKDWEPLETHWMEQSKIKGYKLVNNRQKGGGGPEYCTEEHKMKISQANIGKPKPDGFGLNHSIKTKGKKRPPRSKEHSKKISKGMMKSINQYDMCGNFIKEWDSALSASKHLGKPSGAAITECCRKVRKSIWGFKWEWK